jgi:putative flippase GtrA
MVRYLVVGVSSAAIEFVLFVLGNSVLHIDVVISNPVAITCATVFNYILSRNYTFKTTKSPVRSLLLYALLFVFNQVFSTTAIVLLTGMGIPSPLAKVLTMGCIVLWNFVLYRKVVFR